MEDDANATLVPSVIQHLRIEAGIMERSLSSDIREEREDLREAAEQTLNVILDLGLNGIIRWVSPSWEDVVGTTPDSVQGKPITDILLGENKDMFSEAVASMREDDASSQIIRFTVEIGPSSKLTALEDRGICEPVDTPLNAEEQTNAEPDPTTEIKHHGCRTVEVEGQGIMVYDRSTGTESHTMWMLRPWFAPAKLEIPIPIDIQEQLRSGAEILASYINTLAESGLEDPASHPPPLPQLCRICERQIPPWWFERHTEFCLEEHKAEMEVQACQERLLEHRDAIVKVLNALEARRTRQTNEQLLVSTPPAEYKGFPINETPSTNPSSGTSSPGTPPNRSSERPTSGLNHIRARSFAVRRPRARMVELLIDLCDTALEINTPAIKDSSTQAPGEFRTQSPQSESRIQQVWQWQSPVVSEEEQGLSLLCSDSGRLAIAKAEAVIRHQRVIEYAERVRVETSVKVQEYIDDCIRTACDPARSNGSDSDEAPAQEEGFFAGSFDAPSSLAMVLREEEARQGRPASSTAVSTRSSSPKECPTPRSHIGSMSRLLGNPRESRRQSLFFESDAGESEGSIRSSSIMSRPDRTDSPVSEFGDLRRAVNRRSMVLPGAVSPRRQESPSRLGPPSSPLRISKPRVIPNSLEGLQSPTVSPFLASSEFSSPVIVPNHHHHHHHHHRRKSSVVDGIKLPPPSPRLSSVSTSVGAPQARAVPPSIKDFEIIKPISKGAFGSVYLSKKKSTGDYFAIKVLKKADMVAKNQVTNVKAERAIMMFQGESDFVAKLYWTFSSKDYLYLVMEYLNGGDCASLIKVLGGLPEDWAKKYLGEVIMGVEHLHSRGIVHRDLKPDNLLIDQKGHLKLTDFGLSRMGLLGRQKRVLNSAANESAPDLLKTGPFARSSSLTSSRSTSFDFHGHHSPGSTPQIEPDPAGNLAQPSYFSLTKDKMAAHESRRTSGHRSDSNGSESLHSLFNAFSLDEPRSNKRVDDGEAEHSPDLQSVHKTMSNTSADQHHRDREVISQASMLPPPPPHLALFDPDDSNRRFVGTPDYLAPETVSGIGQDEMSDWWSVGCILFEFLYGYPPFHDETPDKVFENILARKISWPDDEDFDVSSEAKDLMNRVLCMDPRQRIGANNDDKFSSGGAEIRAHSWFDGFGWDTLLKDEAQFIPAPENPEDTEYFDTRGATLQAFAEEMEDQLSPAGMTPGADYVDRPHDALSRVRSQVNSMKRGLMPLHIPPHVRSEKTRRLSEPVQADDFGNFSFKNLPVLEKANKDVIQKLRAEAMTAQSKNAAVVSPSHQTTPSSPSPALEGSPMLPMPIKRTLSSAKCANRPGSPSTPHAAASPSRVSQPSSPLLISFIAGHNAENRRKTSSTSSSLSHQSASSLQPGSFFEVPRTSGTQQATASAAGSPSKARGTPAPLALSPQKLNPPTPRQSSNPSSRTRSQTVGSQEGSPVPIDMFSHHKRRSQVFDMSPSSSDNEAEKANALLRVQRRRQSSRRMSAITLLDGPVFRPLDVLICEDHPVSRMVMEKLLEKLRCRTITVSNGAEALRYACSEIKFDIIMMEFKLPQINGADVARMIRDTKNINAHTPIIAITGYLKELQAPHYFDALIEKPPTTSKLTEVMSSLCQWKAPIPGQPTYAGNPPPSGLRQESLRLDDSPTSGSSGYANMPAGSFRGSSREDSISSSMFGDSESVVVEDVPVGLHRQGTGDWVDKGLGGHHDDGLFDPKDNPLSPPAHLRHQLSAPGQLQHITPRTAARQRSSERIRAKREIMDMCGESGDDEDEELGDVAVKEKIPKNAKHAHRGSKLGTEMMRTNSRGSVVSAEELTTTAGDTKAPPSIVEEEHQPSPSTMPNASITPPEYFTSPGKEVADIEMDMDETPRPTTSDSRSPIDTDPTPRLSYVTPERPRNG